MTEKQVGAAALIASGATADVLRDEHVMRAYLGTEEVL